jgi:propionate CoA-transferase
MRNKVVTPREAVAIIHSGDTLCCSGFGSNGTPDELILALERRFLDTGEPHDLTLLFGGGPGDGKDRGVNRLAHDGLLKRVVGGHYGLVPKIGELAMANKVEAYNLPLGCISRLYRDVAAGLPGSLSKVGLGTFVDPRNGGGKTNGRTCEDLVELVTLAGRELLFYRAIPINVAFIRGTFADPAGNLVMDRESLTQDVLAIAAAARNSGGFVIVQVERLVDAGSLNPRRVKVPGILVDCIVIAQPENHLQTYGTPYDAAFSAEARVPLEGLPPMPLDERKIIARRAAFELLPNSVVNLGIGMPEGVAAVANEEKILRYLTLTAEPGIIGGVPANGLNFGAAVNPDAVIDMNQQFDFYDGGGLDLACLGLAECDAEGNINVSCFGPKLAGAGGFINITQNSRTVIFVGTFTAGGLEIAVNDGRLLIVKEGRARKFVKRVGQVTFSGKHAEQGGQAVYYVTERCVFRLAEGGIELIEIAPGIDLDKDILAHMEFKPLVRNLTAMDQRIFRPEPMGLKDSLLSISLEDRITYDPKQETLFYNFEGLTVRSSKDIEAIRQVVEKHCRGIGKKVNVVVNYDAFQIAEDLLDEYGEMVRYLSDRYYRQVSRYTTSAFMRMKLGEALSRRGLSAHVFETRQEAVDFSKRAGLTS